MDVPSNETLRGRVALVTGASCSIGAAVAEQLAGAGAAVAVNHLGSDQTESAAGVVKRIVARGGRAQAYEADVADEGAVDAMVRRIRDELGACDLLVNNAATSVAAQRPWEGLEVADWDRVLRVNVTGAFLCARAVYAGMRRAGRGDIVSMSSVTALLGKTGNLHYVTSKAALLGFTRALAREVGEHGIRVNALVVGAIKTPDEAIYGPQDELDAQLAALQSLKRRGEPVDVGDAVVALCSGSLDFVTGQCLTLDGGWVMH